ncbi:hypothetical protein GUITHDRAFT_132822 [Guillardia theta CCMP2712]|uniref:Transmembrane protein n=1 Tax=Guillardia theta (strain CCMP2712) TaxID=905079 RepID=L1JZK5_GUITC|nr:hypothetical protein GUITHDRAFT_132822 [Guillardia theta CCMP2712]EKX53767.1 hypothetical protein GUITHDRAFT_132822 [Guillardia theta CCMP2712]|eukprot:XP_005840747.1 hypothetical protein GUITHDRAFT_132822 [Guillardia theta CCMP2712]
MIRRIITAVLVFMFLMAGANKVSPHINAEMHNHLSKAFPPMGKMWSGLLRDFLASLKQEQYHDLIEKNLLDDGSGSYKMFMTNLGYMCPLPSLILFLIMIAATYTHHVMKEPIVVTVGLMVLFVVRALLPVPKSAGKKVVKPKKS